MWNLHKLNYKQNMNKTVSIFVIECLKKNYICKKDLNNKAVDIINKKWEAKTTLKFVGVDCML